jgi:S-DNA-T family DNA segregation ATPase FtsK/SpoIIIE
MQGCPMAKRKNTEEIITPPRNTFKNKEVEEDVPAKKLKQKSVEKEKEEPQNKKVKKEKVVKEDDGTGFIARVKRFITDERTVKITGLFLIGFSVFLLVSFISYFFSWKGDQTMADGGFSVGERPKNVMGFIGAKLAHWFLYSWFGVPSFLLVPVFFLLGVRLLYKRNLVKLNRTISILFFLTIWSSGALALLLPTLGGGILGGSFGFKLNQVLGSFAGIAGSLLIYGVSFLTFLIIAYNSSLKLPAIKWFNKKSPKTKDDISSINFDESDTSLSTVTNVYAHRDEIEIEETEPVVDELDNIPIDELPDFEVNEVIEDDFVTVDKNIFMPEKDVAPEFDIIEPSVDAKNNEVPEVEFSLANTDPDGFSIVNTNPEPDPEPIKKTAAEDLVSKYGLYDSTIDLPKFKMPELKLLVDYGDNEIKINKEELEDNKNRIVETLRNYNIDIAKIKATVGPTVTLYEIVPAPGVRISKIKNLEDDIALSLAALGIRIIAPIPGKGTIGIEVPNQSPEIVSMHSLLKHEKFINSKYDLPIALGKTISNEVYIADLAKMPHLLMAGATGQGKSVGLNAILVSLLYKKHPSQIKFVMVDPKKVELTLYNKIEKHYLAKLPGEEEPIITDVKKVIHTLNSLCIEMDTRYELLKIAQVRTIKEYNEKFTNRKLNPNDGHRYLPYIVLVIDEFADLIMTAGKEVEMPIARLAQLARAIGIHLIIATQRPSVNIITGTIKANFPARIAFRVSSKIDSRTILDAGGAEQLIGRGDMLLSLGSDLIRLQCPFVDTPEVDSITEFIGDQQGYPEALQLPEFVGEEGKEKGEFDVSQMDDLFEEAARIVVIHQQGSASLLQRRLNLGYNRAGRLIDQMEAIGIVGPNQGSKARNVLITDEAALEEFLRNLK